MEKHTSFSDVLEAADALSIDEQQTLVEVLSRRVTEARRAELVKDVAAAGKEFQSGGCRPATPDELIAEISE